MTDRDLKTALAAHADPPAFDAVVAGRAPRRLRRARIGVLALIVIAAAAPIALRREEPEIAVALIAPPTTDWLLETPDPEWLASLDDPTKENP